MFLTDLDFSSFGDADQYAIIAEQCAKFIQGVPETTCFNGIRPIGVGFIYAIPYLLTNDSVSISYMTLAINISFLALLVFSCLKIFQYLLPSPNSVIRNVFSALLVLTMIFFSVAFIPVRMSDLLSISTFSLGLYFTVTKPLRRESLNFILGGLFAGGAVLFKQNYAIFTGTLLLWWIVMTFRELLRTRFKALFLFMAGSLIALVQPIWVYLHTGDFWMYKLDGLDSYAGANKQPYVELIAYTQPIRSAFLSRLDREVNPVDFFTIKYFEGVSRFDWSSYLGGYGKLDEVIIVGKSLLIPAYLVLFLSLILIGLTFFYWNSWLTIIFASSLTGTFIEVSRGHIENRYFLDLRIFTLLTLVILVASIFSSRITSEKKLWRKPNLFQSKADTR